MSGNHGLSVGVGFCKGDKSGPSDAVENLHAIALSAKGGLMDANGSTTADGNALYPFKCDPKATPQAKAQG